MRGALRTPAGLHPTGILPGVSTAARGAARRLAVEARWGWLAFAWGLYYFLVHSVGRYEQYTQKVIWLGGLAVGALTVVACKRELLKVPKETLLLLGLMAWALTGLPEVYSFGQWAYYMRLMAQMAIMIALVAPVMRRSGGAHWFYVAFILSAVFNVLQRPGGRTYSMMEGLRAQTRQDALGGGPNTFGWYGFLGLLGVLVLLGEVKSTWRRVLILWGGALSLFAIVSSASRGAFVASALAFVLWPTLCLRVRVRQFWLYLALSIAVVSAGVFFSQYIYTGSLLSERMERTAEEEQRGSSRWDLMVQTVRVFSQEPVNGAGLGQFAFASGTGLYAHTEFAELLATTGLVGIAFYYGVYILTWRRLALSLRRLKDPFLRYRVNCARMALIVVVISGIFFKPHFLVISSDFLIAMIVGMSYWAEAQANAISGEPGPTGAEVHPAKLGSVA